MDGLLEFRDTHTINDHIELVAVAAILGHLLRSISVSQNSQTRLFLTDSSRTLVDQGKREV